MTDDTIGDELTPEMVLVEALADGDPVTVDMVAACSAPVLADMALSALRSDPVAPSVGLNVPRSVAELIGPDPGPVNDGSTPAVVYLLAVARGDPSDHLAATVNVVGLAWLVVRAREQPGTSNVVERLELVQATEWARLRQDMS